jgi:hypothetical protein
MNLAGSTPGDTYTAVMTASAINPSSGTIYRVEWGNGVATNLYLGNGIVGVGTSTSALSALTSEATAVRAVAFPDQAGRVSVAANLQAILGADFTHSTNSVANITGLTLTLPVGTWLVTFAGNYQSSNVDNGVLFSMTGSSATVAGGATQGDPQGSDRANADLGTSGHYLVTVASGTGTVQMRVNNESGSRTATVKAGAFICALRIA